MTSDARPDTRILGSLRSADGKGVGRVEDRFDTDIDDLWSETWRPASASSAPPVTRQGASPRG